MYVHPMRKDGGLRRCLSCFYHLLLPPGSIATTTTHSTHCAGRQHAGIEVCTHLSRSKVELQVLLDRPVHLIDSSTARPRVGHAGLCGAGVQGRGGRCQRTGEKLRMTELERAVRGSPLATTAIADRAGAFPPLPLTWHGGVGWCLRQATGWRAHRPPHCLGTARRRLRWCPPATR